MCSHYHITDLNTSLDHSSTNCKAPCRCTITSGDRNHRNCCQTSTNWKGLEGLQIPYSGLIYKPPPVENSISSSHPPRISYRQEADQEQHTYISWCRPVTHHRTKTCKPALPRNCTANRPTWTTVSRGTAQIFLGLHHQQSALSPLGVSSTTPSINKALTASISQEPEQF